MGGGPTKSEIAPLPRPSGNAENSRTLPTPFIKQHLALSHYTHQSHTFIDFTAHAAPDEARPCV